MGTNYRVKCFHCGVEVPGIVLKEQIDPQAIHRSANNLCRFVHGEVCGNIGVDASIAVVAPITTKLADINYYNYGCRDLYSLVRLMIASLRADRINAREKHLNKNSQ